MNTPVSSRIDPRFGIVDLHCHPSLMYNLFGSKFWNAHKPPSWYYPWTMRVDIDALITGGVKAFLCATYVLERDMFADVWPLRMLAGVYPPGKRLATAPMDILTREYLDSAEKMVEETRRRRGDVIEVAKSFDDMKRITAAGKVCMLHSVEGAHHLNGNIDMIDELAVRGVCHMIVPHLYPNDSGGCIDVFGGMHLRNKFGCFRAENQNTSSLSAWGRELIEKLLEVGILVDPTHGTREYRRQVFDIIRGHPKKRPMIMSHSCVPSLSPESMGPMPEEIREIADSSGVVGLMMYTNREPEQHYKGSGIDFVVRGVEHLIQYGGEEVVAIGSDFDGTPHVPKDLRTPRDFRSLREALLQKYSEEQVSRFLNGNAERALKLGWGK